MERLKRDEVEKHIKNIVRLKNTCYIKGENIKRLLYDKLCVSGNTKKNNKKKKEREKKY